MTHNKKYHGIQVKSIIIAVSLVATLQAAYASSYQEVYDIVFKTPQNNTILTSPSLDIPLNDTQEIDPIVQAEKLVYAEGALPAYKVTFAGFTKKVVQQLASRTQQTLVDKVDYYDRLEKLVHSNGICMAGTWNITETGTNADNQSYTGMFAKGASSLFIGRLSVALSETKQGEKQAFSMAGKIFGTNDMTKDVTTESFFVGDVLSGIKRDSVFSAAMSTKPQVKFRFALIPLAFKIGGLFGKADKNADMRPVTGIARMGIATDSAGSSLDKDYVSPKYMMIQPIKPDNHIITEGIDFRDEFALPKTQTNDTHATHDTMINNTDIDDKKNAVENNQDNGNTTMVREFSIHVSDTANYNESNLEQNNWQQIGTITATETIVSYGCDRQLHFSHPKSE